MRETQQLQRAYARARAGRGSLEFVGKRVKRAS
jgi:hypothetical protein